MRLIFEHPLFLVGFRPLFSLAMISAIFLPAMWVLILTGHIHTPDNLQIMSWHAHEMFYGFGWAVLGGFLLTASKNWVKIRGLNGAPLVIISLFWVFERYLIFNTEVLTGNELIRTVFLNAYMLGVSSYVLWSLWKYRQNDSYTDNFFFFLMLSFFFIAKNLMLSPSHYQVGTSMTLGLFRLAFAVMFERTMTQFMKTTEQVELYRNKALDYLIKFLVLISVFESFFVTTHSGMLLITTGVVLFLRWTLWAPLKGFKKFGNAVMYIGYLGLVIHFVLEGLLRYGIVFGSSTTPLHTFTFLTMGVVISGMLIRICQGHTGRKPQFTWSDKVAIYSILIAAVLRLLAPVVYPQYYSYWITCAGILWSLCFVILTIRLIPYLFKPRIDGKVH